MKLIVYLFMYVTKALNEMLQNSNTIQSQQVQLGIMAEKCKKGHHADVKLVSKQMSSDNQDF